MLRRRRFFIAQEMWQKFGCAPEGLQYVRHTVKIGVDSVAGQDVQLHSYDAMVSSTSDITAYRGRCG